MATNKSNESIDDKAFQALEDALKIDFDELKSALNDKASPDHPEDTVSGAAKQASAPSAAKSQKAQQEQTAKAARAAETQRALSPEPAPKAPSFAPANDDGRKTPAAILRSLDVRSSRSAMRIAAAVSALWIVGGLGVANLLYGPEIWQIRSLADLSAMPGAIGVAIFIVLPVMLFFSFAIMISRAQELRSAARSMAEVALRLAEPETAASERIMTVGQAVRREVSAMNEGIERTIARATELETLVHSEVNALERSYSDNELRVRTLVQELGLERESIVGHAERIRSSISGAHTQLKDELAIAGDDISNRIATSGEAFASMIETRAAALMERSDNATQTIGAMLSTRTDALLSGLTTAGVSLSNEFDTRLDNLSQTLAKRGQQLLGQFETRASSLDANTEKLNAALNERARQLNETLIARTRDLNESLNIGQQAITGGLDDILNTLNATLDEKGANFRQSLKSSADDMIMDIDLRTGFFDEKLQTTVGHLATAFDSRFHEFATAFDKRASLLDSKLMESLARINQSVTGGADSIGGILDGGIDRFETAPAGSVADIGDDARHHTGFHRADHQRQDGRTQRRHRQRPCPHRRCSVGTLRQPDGRIDGGPGPARKRLCAARNLA